MQWRVEMGLSVLWHRAFIRSLYRGGHPIQNLVLKVNNGWPASNQVVSLELAPGIQMSFNATGYMST